MNTSVLRMTLAIIIGALLGGAVGSLIYLSINPVLEASTGPLREMQGLLWNVVPGLTIVGGVLGWLIFGRPRK
jgi:tetrahydromethanopterin S-methyltransferase subunit D